MSNYDDMRHFQMQEQSDGEYIAPTVAYTGEDFERLLHDQGGDVDAANEIMLEVMDRDMDRHARQLAERCLELNNEVARLREILDTNDIDY